MKILIRNSKTDQKYKYIQLYFTIIWKVIYEKEQKIEEDFIFTNVSSNSKNSSICGFDAKEFGHNLEDQVFYVHK
jgi:hypothetical protein